MAGNRQYDHEYKVQAVKLAKEIGQAKAAEELGAGGGASWDFPRISCRIYAKAASSPSSRSK